MDGIKRNPFCRWMASFSTCNHTAFRKASIEKNHHDLFSSSMKKKIDDDDDDDDITLTSFALLWSDLG